MISHRIHVWYIWLTFGVYWWDPCYHIWQHHGSYGYGMAIATATPKHRGGAEWHRGRCLRRHRTAGRGGAALAWLLDDTGPTGCTSCWSLELEHGVGAVLDLNSTKNWQCTKCTTTSFVWMLHEITWNYDVILKTKQPIALNVCSLICGTSGTSGTSPCRAHSGACCLSGGGGVAWLHPDSHSVLNELGTWS